MIESLDEHKEWCTAACVALPTAAYGQSAVGCTDVVLHLGLDDIDRQCGMRYEATGNRSWPAEPQYGSSKLCHSHGHAACMPFHNFVHTRLHAAADICIVCKTGLDWRCADRLLHDHCRHSNCCSILSWGYCTGSLFHRKSKQKVDLHAMVTRFPFLPRRHYKTALRLQTVSQGSCFDVQRCLTVG